MTTPTTAWAIGLANISDNDQILDVWYPAPGFEQPDDADYFELESNLRECETTNPICATSRRIITTSIDLTQPPASVDDAFLRLHLLSARLCKPNSINLEGIFSVLPNIAWTSSGPCLPENLDRARLRALQAGIDFTVRGMDKFPQMLDYVTPDGVRIADAARVRLGAYLSPGTTIMHEGFVNFNAGTLGKAMIEGRVSQGVVIGDGSDIGGGASTMGTLSGGGQQLVSLGERCLLGANSGVGISLGDDCIVEAGLYITAGTKIRTISAEGRVDTTVARDLSGKPGLLYRRNSLTGQVEAIERTTGGVILNSALHKQ